MMAMTRIPESNRPSDCLLLAFELGQRAWKLGFAVGMGQRHACARSQRARSVPSRTRSLARSVGSACQRGRRWSAVTRRDAMASGCTGI